MDLIRWIGPMSLFVIAAAGWRGYQDSPHFGERINEMTLKRGVRLQINAPGREAFRETKPTRLIVYALPNGNTIEQTIGRRRAGGIDWRFDIQHIGAQTRLLREIDESENIFVVYLEAPGLSWPRWGLEHASEGKVYSEILQATLNHVPAGRAHITLTGHSGGGSFCFGLINEHEAIPRSIRRIAFLDSNYSYNDAEHRHGDKLLRWLRQDEGNRLIVLAYDDRNVTLKGKRVVSESGGTYGATHRMIERFKQAVMIHHSTAGAFDVYRALDGRVCFYVHRNPDNKILHTALVGKMNGYLHALTLGTPFHEAWGSFGGQRAYTRWIQPAEGEENMISPPRIPNRPADAMGGKAFMQSVPALSLAEREAAIFRELSRGNLPDFLRRFKTIRVTANDAEGVTRTAEYQVTPDYLAIGGDEDFVRVPMTPGTAQKVADLFGCRLPTKKMVDDVDAHAELKLAPSPMTHERESVATFVAHNEIIERQRRGYTLGALLCGVKKDVVITNRLSERPNRVAIYGWRKLDGSPIQPLTIVHVDTYVDYSHGVRLVNRRMIVDGHETTVEAVLADSLLCSVLSDEGPIKEARYR